MLVLDSISIAKCFEILENESSSYRDMNPGYTSIIGWSIYRFVCGTTNYQAYHGMFMPHMCVCVYITKNDPLSKTSIMALILVGCFPKEKERDKSVWLEPDAK